MTFDAWTSSNGAGSRDYIAITAHWIDDDWELKEATLDVQEVNASHTGREIAERVTQVLDIYDIREQVRCFWSGGPVRCDVQVRIHGCLHRATGNIALFVRYCGRS